MNYSRPQHFLYFFPLPHGQGAFRPTLLRGDVASIGSECCGICGLKGRDVRDSVVRPSSRSMVSRGTRTGACPMGSGIVRISMVTCCRPADVRQVWRGVLLPKTGKGVSIHSMYCLSIISCKLTTSSGVISTGWGLEIRSSIGRSSSRSSQRRVLTLRKTTPGSLSSHLRPVANRLAELTVNTNNTRASCRCNLETSRFQFTFEVQKLRRGIIIDGQVGRFSTRPAEIIAIH